MRCPHCYEEIKIGHICIFDWFDIDLETFEIRTRELNVANCDWTSVRCSSCGEEITDEVYYMLNGAEIIYRRDR